MTLVDGERSYLEQHEGVGVLLLDVVQSGPQQLGFRAEQVHAAAQGVIHEPPAPRSRERKHHLRVVMQGNS